MNQIEIQFKKLHPNARIPFHGSPLSAGYDVYAAIDEPVIIHPHETQMIGTGFSLELPDEYFAGIYARSGLATKRGLRPANCIGVCDADYRGEYIVALHNDTDQIQQIDPNERIAQLIIQPRVACNFIIADTLSETERGDGGFGHTDKRQ